MRTTLTLDDDVARLVEDAVHRERVSMKQVINDALRRGLADVTFTPAPFRVEAHPTAFRPGIDVARLNQLADALADEAALGGSATA